MKSKQYWQQIGKILQTVNKLDVVDIGDKML